MRLSIIIPTIGRPTLTKVLETLFLNKNFEQIKPQILICYDGEGFNRALLGGHADAVEVYETGQRSGAATARNVGIEQSSGDIICFIGDDTEVAPNWLNKLWHWHQSHPAHNTALLGRVDWMPGLADDPFHHWLWSAGLFDFKSLSGGNRPTWRHFYTSNISLKRALIGEDRFESRFKGWGFEDAEFGYRLSKKGLKITFDQDLKVFHDDPQTLDSVVARTRQARANARFFETLHPEVRLQPQGAKRLVLKGLVTLTKPLDSVPQIKWWRAWKQAWLEG